MKVSEFQELIKEIYFHQDKERGLKGTFIWLVEEVGELARIIKNQRIDKRKASEEIAKDKSGLWIGLWWVIIFCVCYSGTVLIFYLLGHVPMSTPFLPIPIEKWYLVQTFTTLPVGLAGFLAYSGLAYILCKHSISNLLYMW